MHNSSRSIALKVLMCAGVLASPARPAGAQAQKEPGTAELPRVFLDTRMPPAGKRIVVNAHGDFQAALNRAQPGDEIVLEAGATYSGRFNLPPKPGSRTPGTGSVIVIRSSAADKLPEGKRVSPADSVFMPRILTNANGAEAIGTSAESNGWRLIGLDISAAANVTQLGRLIRLGDGSPAQNVATKIPANIVVDRSYLHLAPSVDIKRCIDLQSAATAIIDSYIAGCHSQGSDAQAIAGWNGPGPYKIVNNYLEASSENVAWGGADPAIQNMIPSDIEIRHNYITRPASWKGGPWLIKNLYESKASTRVLIEGNVFENNWLHGQGGSAILLKSTNQDGRCTWCGTSDVTFHLNLIRNTGSGFNLAGAPDPHDTQVHLQRITITDNVMENIDVAPFNGDGRGIQILNDPSDIIIMHNTIIDPSSTAISFGGPLTPAPRHLVFRDNIIGGGKYGIKGPGLAGGSASLAPFLGGGDFTRNAIILTDAHGYPANGIYVTSVQGVGFVDPAAHDFHLGPYSPLRAKGTDGKDLGADVSALNAAIVGVVPH